VVGEFGGDQAGEFAAVQGGGGVDFEAGGVGLDQRAVVVVKGVGEGVDLDEVDGELDGGEGRWTTVCRRVTSGVV